MCRTSLHIAGAMLHMPKLAAGFELIDAPLTCRPIAMIPHLLALDGMQAPGAFKTGPCKSHDIYA